MLGPRIRLPRPKPLLCYSSWSLPVGEASCPTSRAAPPGLRLTVTVLPYCDARHPMLSGCQRYTVHCVRKCRCGSHHPSYYVGNPQQDLVHTRLSGASSTSWHYQAVCISPGKKISHVPAGSWCFDRGGAWSFQVSWLLPKDFSRFHADKPSMISIFMFRCSEDRIISNLA